MRRFVSTGVAFFGVVVAALGVHGCNKQSVTVNLRSLHDSTEVTFVCRGMTEQGDDHGLALTECPDVQHIPAERTMLALLTQNATNELAIVDVAAQKVVDVDPAVPGYTFLRLPSRPGALATTPGGEASFVGLTTPGKTGISAIPTTCLSAPQSGQSARDLTTFAACSLPSAPGDLAIVVEPPSADGTIYTSCDATEAQSSDPPPSAGANRDCPANLALEHGPAGRRKLVVALPETGQLAVLDAQELLDRAQGSFAPCTIEKLVDLDASPDASGQQQSPPPDLEGGCTPNRPASPPVAANARSRPSGIAQSADAKLYVGDLGVPAVHVMDVTSVCAMRELPPLLPMAFTQPDRFVTTSQVAVSPLTPAGHRYVYAVDATDTPTSVMAFDVSPGATNRTPIVRNGSSRQPREVPDRISFGTPIRDIDFAYRDLPREQLETGVAELGVRCDPNPDAPTDPPSPGVQNRTSGDYTQGARPRLLRGLFGLALLTSGQVVVIDIDDFDAPCRRPTMTNSDATEPDFRGCVGDTVPYSYLTLDGSSNGTRTVSGEVSCNMVEPHRPRAAAFGVSAPTLGIGAPSLRGLPQFSSPPSVASLDPSQAPKLLAVPFENPGGTAVPPEVYVGTTLYSVANASGQLSVDPTNAHQLSSLTLPFYEPRAYATGDEHVEVTYEGRVFAAAKLSGFLAPDPEKPGSDAEPPGLLLKDSTAFFCNSGVYDPQSMTEYAENELGIKDGAAAFGDAHGDYVQVTGDYPDLLDAYWHSAPHDRAYCRAKFGEPAQLRAADTEAELQVTRDLKITAAYQDHLQVTPRVPAGWTPADCDPAAKNRYCPPTLEDFTTCFPSGIRYTVRGANQWVLLSNRPEATYDITAQPFTPPPTVDNPNPETEYRCVPDCDPRKRYFHNRVFEVGLPAGCKASGTCTGIDVGEATSLDGPCFYDGKNADGTTRGLNLDDPGAACIFENLTARFGVYRGTQPSVRGMRFAWDTTGGFYPLAASLSSVSSSVLPQRVRYVPEYQSLAVVDGASLGFSLLSLDTLRIVDPGPVY
jgi:hypothetical protein